MISITLDSGTEISTVCAELRVKIIGIQSLFHWEKSEYLSLMHLGVTLVVNCLSLDYLGCVFACIPSIRALVDIHS